MKTLQTTAAAAAMAAFAAGISTAAQLQPVTLLAWGAYLKEADVRVEQRIAGRQPFLWTDETADREARVRGGEIVIAPVVNHGVEGVPDGLIHDWIGAIFIPGATIDSLLAVVHDYDRYQRMYRPAVTASKTLACAGARQQFQMVWQRRILFVNAAVEGHYQARDVIVDARRGYSVADSVEIREIERYGQADAHLLPPDTGNGFIWRIRSVARFEERDGGVYLELEAMALTREIPASLGWIANRVVNHLSVSSLAATLRQTRDAVISLPRDTEALASCPNPGHAFHSAKTAGE